MKHKYKIRYKSLKELVAIDGENKYRCFAKVNPENDDVFILAINENDVDNFFKAVSYDKQLPKADEVWKKLGSSIIGGRSSGYIKLTA